MIPPADQPATKSRILSFELLLLSFISILPLSILLLAVLALWESH